MSHQIHTHVLGGYDIEEMMDSYDESDPEEALKIWVYNQYPIARVSYFSLDGIDVETEGDEVVEARVKVIER